MKTATESRVETMEKEIAFQSMCMRHELSQSEAIVRHYLSLYRLVQITYAAMKSLEPEKEVPKHVREFIDTNIDAIKRCHAKDFGIELKWEHPNHYPTPTVPPQS